MRLLHLSVLIILFIPINASAWGFAPHNKVASEAIVLSDGEFFEFLKTNSDKVKSKSNEPDRMKDKDPTEGPRHYDDSDIDHLDINVSSSSKDYDLGVISWAVHNSTHKLVDAILANNADDIVHYAGYLAHYAADSTQPFHATANYDGQLTGNSGIHSRFESELVSKNFDEIFSNITTSDLIIVDPYNSTKDIIRSGLQLVDEVLAADDLARVADDYYSKLWELTSTIVISRLDLAIKQIANLWYTAFQIAISRGMTVFNPVFQPTTENITSITNTQELSLSYYLMLLVLPVLPHKQKLAKK